MAERHGIDTAAKPSGTGCAECLRSEAGWWFHLRRCAECGHIGCCDSSPGQHATGHFEATGHRMMASFEPGEAWFYDYGTKRMMEGPALAAPRWHPAGQAVPGPEERVPEDWQERLH